MNLTETGVWRALDQHYLEVRNLHMRDLFAKDYRRFEKFSVSACDILLDYSKNRINAETVELLITLATKADLKSEIHRMLSGEPINATENRSVLHTALRLPRSASLSVDGVDVVAEVHQVADQAAAFVDSVRDGTWHGYSGKTIDTVVNIGIGGSDLGPLMVCEALKPWQHERLQFHFVSNVDGTHMAEVLRQVNFETTLFIIASKTFTTLETLANANTARSAFLQSSAAAKDIARHFVAVSTNEEAVAAFGIDTANMFHFWDWVRGALFIMVEYRLTDQACGGQQAL